jgi:cation:H+ antiporter
LPTDDDLSADGGKRDRERSLMALSPDLLLPLSVGVVALYTLITAAERAIDAFLSLARHYDVPEELLGMTVIAVGTSLPELTAHLVASVGIVAGRLDYQVTSAVVIGGNMGSSTTQQTLLLGLFLVGFGRLRMGESMLRESYLPMVLALALTLLVSLDGSVSRVDGGVLLVAYGLYTYYSFTRRPRTMALPESRESTVRRDAVVGVVALGLVVLSATLLLSVAQGIVDSLALGGSMVGVVTLGVASALPELSTVLDAVRRRSPNLALGTLFGSNVVNPLLGLGLGGLVSTYHVPSAVVLWDLPFKLVVALALLGYLLFVSDRTLTRREGAYLVVCYFVFVSVRLLVFPSQ